MEIIKVNSLSEFKKNIQIGRNVGCLFHRERVIGRDGEFKYVTIERPVRKVSIKQSNAFALRTTRTDGKEVDSYCHYPKASDCKFNDGKMTIYEYDRTGVGYPLLTFWILQDEKDIFNS